MADVTTTIVRLDLNTLSSDLIAGGQDHNTGETGEVSVAGDTELPYTAGDDRLILCFEEVDGSTASVVIDAGDYPPSALASKGSLTLPLAANDLKLVQLEAGRFLQSDGKITWTITGGVKVFAFRLPPSSSEA